MSRPGPAPSVAQKFRIKTQTQPPPQPGHSSAVAGEAHAQEQGPEEILGMCGDVAFLNILVKTFPLARMEQASGATCSSSVLVTGSWVGRHKTQTVFESKSRVVTRVLCMLGGPWPCMQRSLIYSGLQRVPQASECSPGGLGSSLRWQVSLGAGPRDCTQSTCIEPLAPIAKNHWEGPPEPPK